jgi:pSer/pThr/pTyr-binding forkhead associated (FHA) protein
MSTIQNQLPKTTEITGELSEADMKELALALENARQEREGKLGTGTFILGTTLKMEVQDFPNPLIVDVNREMVIGRSDAHTNYVPDIDLSPYGAYRLGISRRHVILRPHEKSLQVIDLGSRNGSRLNGNVLEKDKPITLHSGDELAIGTLIIQLSYLKRQQ